MAASRWQLNKDLAKTILGSRYLRRRILLYLCSIVVAMMGLGGWPLADWLMDEPWRFFVYWIVCAGVTGFMALLALYDILAVIREEKTKIWQEIRSEIQDNEEETE